jgi:hypothetical protein
MDCTKSAFLNFRTFVKSSTPPSIVGEVHEMCNWVWFEANQGSAIGPIGHSDQEEFISQIVDLCYVNFQRLCRAWKAFSWESLKHPCTLMNLIIFFLILINLMDSYIHIPFVLIWCPHIHFISWATLNTPPPVLMKKVFFLFCQKTLRRYIIIANLLIKPLPHVSLALNQGEGVKPSNDALLCLPYEQ